MLWALEHTLHFSLYLLRMINSYLKGRALFYDTLEGQTRIDVVTPEA